MLPYKVLAQTNPEYKSQLWQELGDLYVGGYTILERAKSYLPKITGETEPRYEERLKTAAYISYFGQIVDFYLAHLACHDLSILPASDAEDDTTPGTLPDLEFWREFAKNSDLRETPFSSHILDVLRSALIRGKALLAVDFPALGDVYAASQADEDALGRTRAYVFEIPAEQLIDWEYETQIRRTIAVDTQGNPNVTFEIGKFSWCITRCSYTRRNGPTGARGDLTEEYKVWERDPATGIVGWKLYAITYDPKKGPPKPEDPVPLVDQGVTSFTEIPILEFKLPPGLWLGNKIGPLAKEHYQRRSALLAAENKSLFAVPFVKLGPEIGGAYEPVPSEVQQDPNRGRDPKARFMSLGYVAIGKDDDLGFAAPDPSAYELIDRELSGLVDEMFRTASQMASSVSSTSKALDRSGLSKQEDNRSTTVILKAFGALLRAFGVRVYEFISNARQEYVVWVPHGLDHFDVYDRAEILSEAVQVNQIAIPSKTWKAEYLIQLAQRLAPALPPETQELVRKEIIEGVEEEDDEAPSLVPGQETMPDSDEENGTKDTPPSSQQPAAQPGGRARLSASRRRAK